MWQGNNLMARDRKNQSMFVDGLTREEQMQKAKSEQNAKQPQTELEGDASAPI